MSDETDAQVAREVATEQAYVDEVYTHLERSIGSAKALATEGYARGSLGHEGGLVERDAMVYQSAKRIAQLDAAHEGLVFGRLDMLPEVSQAPRYVGRLGLRDEDHETLLIDWRAPAAAVFYQATSAEPASVVRRRVLRASGRRVVGVEDELLDPKAGADLPIVGEGALMAQLSRARDRSMHSIVATIQAEQDEAIRAPTRGVVEISGGPGTGKTVVALHRVAYLLYSDRRRYESGGVLVIGPSGVFMRYIERVLPSLGETAVALRSLGEVVDGVRAARADVAAVADVKGSARMAEVVRRLARQAVPGAPDELSYFYRDDRLRLGPRELADLRRRLLGGAGGRGRSRGPVTRNRAKARVGQVLVDALWRQVRGDRAKELGKDHFVDTLVSDDDFRDFAAAWWPELDAVGVMRWLRDPAVVRRAADGVLDRDEVDLLAEHWAESLGGDGSFTVGDVPLIDELRYLLGDPPLAPQRDDILAESEEEVDLRPVTTVSDQLGGRSWAPPSGRTEDDGYAHVLVDEAQDLTPMQWRMVARRGSTATWTIVGDPAQSSWPYPDEAGEAREEALRGKARHAFHLSKNYRNSAEVYAFAAAYAKHVGLDADLPEAVRSTGIDPVELAADGDLQKVVRREVVALAEQLTGTVGIVVEASRQAEVNGWLAGWSELVDAAPHAGEAARAEAGGYAAAANDRVVVLTGHDTKGLEFDGIVVVDPDAIEAESRTGPATLYVVLTRATQRLVLVRP
ncbi:AAA family ATPase [Nocardioidaceae bacterium]|nr:AAA family ATPase [Nocardioidaceae bacterium]